MCIRDRACSTGFKLRIETDYNGIGKLQYLARTLELHELDIQYGELVQMTLLVPEDQIDAVEKDITEQTAGKAQMEREEKVEMCIRDSPGPVRPWNPCGRDRGWQWKSQPRGEPWHCL